MPTGAKGNLDGTPIVAADCIIEEAQALGVGMLDTSVELEAASAFKAAVIQADVAAFWDALVLVECHLAWGQALRAISHVPAPQPIR